MKLINTVDAVGHVLCHDMTRIIPGEEKGPIFRKGHVVTEKDIPLLLSIGKDEVNSIAELSEEELDLNTDTPAVNDRFKKMFEIAKDKMTKRGDNQ